MFRDPTKFYLLIALSYSVLIPFSVWNIYEWLKTKDKFSVFNFQFSIKSKIFNLPNIFLLFTLCSLLFLIRPAFFGQLTGTFKQSVMLEEYQQLKNFIAEDTEFHRTLWLPHRGKFAYFTSSHPAVDADSFLRVSSPSGVLTVLKNPANEKLFQEAGIKYVILPEDSHKELFLKDNKYNEKLYQQFRKELSTISWLKKSQEFGAIVVYEITEPKDRFWITSSDRKVTFQTVNPTTHTVSINSAKKGDFLIFNESYDPNWRAVVEGTDQEIISKPYNKLYNSFSLPQDGKYELVVSYAPQKWVNIGGVISLVTLVVVSILIFKKKR